MEKKKTTRQRHFPYQHPTFGRGKNKKQEDAWKKTVYYLWWAFLKRNERYIKTCELEGNDELSELYKDFGDVRGDDFKSWWTESGRGASLFANQSGDTIRVVQNDELPELEVDPALMIVSVPLNLPKKFLLKNFKKILDKHHNQKRGQQYAKQSNAKYQFKGQPNIDALTTALMIYDKKKEFSKMKLWELGRFLPSFRHLFREGIQIDTTDKKTIEATVSRYLKRAKQAIENTSKGMFP